MFYITQKFILNVCDQDVFNFSDHSCTLDHDWLQTSCLKLRFKISTETLSSYLSVKTECQTMNIHHSVTMVTIIKMYFWVT